MAANLERLAKEWAQKGYLQMADYLINGADKARQLGAPESFSVSSLVLKTPEADLIGLAVAEYKSQPLTPELVNKTWGTLWSEWGKRVGKTFDAPSCDRTTEELANLQKENKAVLLVPDSVDLTMLGKMFPQMQGWAVSEGTTITESGKGGSIDVEMDIDSPNRNTNEDQISKLLKQHGRDGQRLRTYIIGSQFSKLLTGHYFDENTTWSRLPGSRGEGRMVRAYFDSDGGLSVYWFLRPQDHVPRMGFRSEGVKKA